MQNILGQITLLVDEYDKALSYYTELLGFVPFSYLQVNLSQPKNTKPMQMHGFFLSFSGCYRIRTCDLYPVKVAL